MSVKHEGMYRYVATYKCKSTNENRERNPADRQVSTDSYVSNRCGCQGLVDKQMNELRNCSILKVIFFAME